MGKSITMDDFPVLAKTITKRITRLYGEHTEHEDALQEALIRAWKDLAEKGITDYNYLVNRAATWAKAYLFDDTKLATGSQRRDTTGITKKKGDAVRDKIKLWVDEYEKLHGRSPKQAEIAKGVGITQSAVSGHMKVIRSNSSWLVRKDGEKNRLDRKSYYIGQIPDAVLYAHMGDDSKNVAGDVAAFTQPSFEDELLSQASFADIVSRYLTEEMRTIVTLYYVGDWTQYEIADYIGSTQSSVMRALKKVHKELAQHDLF